MVITLQIMKINARNIYYFASNISGGTYKHRNIVDQQSHIYVTPFQTHVKYIFSIIFKILIICQEQYIFHHLKQGNYIYFMIFCIIYIVYIIYYK